ncbi:zw10 protein [Echinococcus multilocularis]|uniref:Zw10 protein n=1 Tax=Echinococcus multilocularis TaxID=6211 RepID=A0A0S4MMD3_ECHMU|nr:zw10 protein [Echinococcus multilocularis]
MFSASALVQSLKNANLSVLCTDVPDESVLLVNETLSVLLLRCLGSGLKVKGGEEEGDEGVGRSLLDFLIYRVPQHLHAQDGLSPGRKILYQKAAIANLLALPFTVGEESVKLARGDVEALSHHLTALVKLKHKSEEHLDLLSGYLSVFSTLDGEEASKVLLGIAADVVQPTAVRKEASFCLSRCLLKGQKGISDEKSIRSLFDGIGGCKIVLIFSDTLALLDLQCAGDCADLVGAAVHLCLAVVIGGSMFTHKGCFQSLLSLAHTTPESSTAPDCLPKAAREQSNRGIDLGRGAQEATAFRSQICPKHGVRAVLGQSFDSSGPEFTPPLVTLLTFPWSVKSRTMTSLSGVDGSQSQGGTSSGDKVKPPALEVWPSFLTQPWTVNRRSAMRDVFLHQRGGGELRHQRRLLMMRQMRCEKWKKEEVNSTRL